MELWPGQDFTAVGDWLKEQPAGPSRDAAVSAYVSRLARETHPSDGFAPWLDTIADADLREATRARLALDHPVP